MNTSGGGIVEQVRNRPLLALGLSLIAGSLLQDYFSGAESGTSRYQPTGRSSYTSFDGGMAAGTYGQAGGSLGQDARNVAGAVGDAAQSAGQAVSNTTQQVVDTARDAASAVVDTAGDVANRVVDTAGDVAYRVADTAGDMAYRVADTAGDVTGEVTERAGDLFSSASNFVSQRPIVALGLSLAAGSLLQQYLRGGQPGARQTYSQQTYSGYQPVSPGYRPDYDLSRGVNAGVNAGRQVGQAASNVAGAVGDAAQNVGQTAAGVAASAVDTTIDAAASVTNTAVDAAQSAGSFVANAADQVVDSAGYAAGQVSETVSDIWPAITRQVQERPLATMGLAIAAGMLLQPTLMPHISAVSSDVRDLWRTASGAVGEVLSLPDQPEVQRIKEAIVPATVVRGQQFISRDMRDYLESSLEGVVGQASLRAGVVAAVTEQAEKLANNRLPNLLNGISGTPALIVLGLTGAVLEARNQAQQGQGQTITNVRTALAQSIVQNAQEQLSRYFPEFRMELQSQESAAQRCSNCNAELAPGTRFCPNCGTAVTGGTSV